MPSNESDFMFLNGIISKFRGIDLGQSSHFLKTPEQLKVSMSLSLDT